MLPDIWDDRVVWLDLRDDPDGRWTLRVADRVPGGGAGRLPSWSVTHQDWERRPRRTTTPAAFLRTVPVAGPLMALVVVLTGTCLLT